MAAPTPLLDYLHSLGLTEAQIQSLLQSTGTDGPTNQNDVAGAAARYAASLASGHGTVPYNSPTPPPGPAPIPTPPPAAAPPKTWAELLAGIGTSTPPGTPPAGGTTPPTTPATQGPQYDQLGRRLYQQPAGTQAPQYDQLGRREYQPPQGATPQGSSGPDLAQLHETLNRLTSSYQPDSGNPSALVSINSLIDAIVAKQNATTGALPGTPGFVTRDQIVTGLGSVRAATPAWGNAGGGPGGPSDPAHWNSEGTGPAGPANTAIPGAPARPLNDQYIAPSAVPAPPPDYAKAAATDRTYAANLSKSDPTRAAMYLDRATQYEGRTGAATVTV